MLLNPRIGNRCIGIQ
uniref:Uncharacterized protein n=1 Tax=Anguilla anguilla TaxID=7936 RepID=A0A0E9RDX3_ANGAN